jgi:UDP-galactopyranose mutase
MARKQNILVVGTGFSGSVIARELAEKDYNVTIIDQREHVGGNCYDEVIDGVRIHRYGPHIFHTNNQKVFEWLSQYTEWVPYQHKVKALYEGQFVTLPPNKKTQEILGNKLFDVLYVPYTTKMWGLPPNEIDDTILNRVKVRNDLNELYFPNDQYQYLPKNGYTKLFEKILNHKNIKLCLNTPFNKSMEDEYDYVFNSMAIDEYYNYCYGELPYRSIKFHNVSHVNFNMPTSVVNFTDYGLYTRITNWSMFPEHGSGEQYTLEEPCDYRDNNYERYYPVKDSEGLNRVIYNKYKDIKNEKVQFIGRCGLYVYIDMDMAISSSLAIVDNFIKEQI